jgi:hemerythrin superfamily protein
VKCVLRKPSKLGTMQVSLFQSTFVLMLLVSSLTHLIQFIQWWEIFWVHLSWKISTSRSSREVQTTFSVNVETAMKTKDQKTSSTTVLYARSKSVSSVRSHLRVILNSVVLKT